MGDIPWSLHQISNQKSQTEANGNVGTTLVAVYNKGTGRRRPGALRCYLTHVSAEQALAAAFTHRATEQEQREIIMSNNNELYWQWFREL